MADLNTSADHFIYAAQTEDELILKDVGIHLNAYFIFRLLTDKRIHETHDSILQQCTLEDIVNYHLMLDMQDDMIYCSMPIMETHK